MGAGGPPSSGGLCHVDVPVLWLKKYSVPSAAAVVKSDEGKAEDLVVG